MYIFILIINCLYHLIVICNYKCCNYSVLFVQVLNCLLIFQNNNVNFKINWKKLVIISGDVKVIKFQRDNASKCH